MIEMTAIRADGSEYIPTHFLYRSAPGTTASEGEPLVPGGLFTRKLACAPELIELSAFGSRPCPYPRTEDVQAVTCPMCMDTAEFKKALAGYQRATR